MPGMELSTLRNPFHLNLMKIHRSQDIMRKITPTLSAIVVVSSFFQLNSVPAYGKIAKCLLVVNGKTYINGSCEFEFTGDSGSFRIDDKKQRLGCYEYDLGPGRCSGAATKVVRNGTFGGLDVIQPGVGKFWWNEGTMRKGEARIPGILRRNGACWESTSVKVCAW